MRALRWTLVVVAIGALPACSRGDGDQPRDRSPAPMPVARTEVAGAVSDGNIVVVGGLTADGSASARADIYPRPLRRWLELPLLPVALHHTAAAVLRDRVFVVGGYTIEGGSWRESARVFSLGGEETEWREEPPLPSPRGAHAVVALRGKLIAVGGIVSGRISGSTDVFEPGAGWKPGPAMARAREHLAATVARGRVYVIAGREGGQNFTDVESWDANAATGWRREPSLNDSRGGIGAATVKGRPCVAGGEETAGTIGSIECLRANRWRRVARLRTPRHGLAVVAVGSRLHVIGGGPQPGLTVSRAHEVFRL